MAVARCQGSERLAVKGLEEQGDSSFATIETIFGIYICFLLVTMNPSNPDIEVDIVKQPAVRTRALHRG